MAMSREKVDAIRRDLESYKQLWSTMLWMELSDPWGAISPSSSERDTLLSKGVFVEDATVSVTVCGAAWTVKASWASWGGEEAFLNNVRSRQRGDEKEEAFIIISRSHPAVDGVLRGVLRSAGRGSLELRGVKSFSKSEVTAEEVNGGKWRLDIDINWAQYYRVQNAIECFCHFEEYPTVFQTLIGSGVECPARKKELNTVNDAHRYLDAAKADQMWRDLNDGQRHAVRFACQHHVSLIQGPPGTGKTQVLELFMNSCVTAQQEEGSGKECPLLAVAPSNVGADNIATRLMKQPNRQIKRFGKCDHPDVKESLAWPMAHRAFQRSKHYWPGAKNKGAKRWMRQWIVDNTEVLVGTLEMSSDLVTQDHQWSSRVIAIDECGQATEPFTLVPLCLAEPGAHVVLIGDHHQLPPTVLNTELQSMGYGTSLFHRLLRSGQIESIMLKEQYRMAPSICCWPSGEYYHGALVSHASTGSRGPPRGFPWPEQSAFAFVDVRGEERISKSHSVQSM